MISFADWQEHILQRSQRGFSPRLRMQLRTCPRLPEALTRHLHAHGVPSPNTLPCGHAQGLVFDPSTGQACIVRLVLTWREQQERGLTTHGVTLRPDARLAIHQAIELAAWHYPHPRRLTPDRELHIQLLDLHGKPLRVPVGGPSLGLAAFVAAWSLLARSRHSNAFLYTGHVVQAQRRSPDIYEVGHLEAKQREADSAGLTLVHPGSHQSVDQVVPKLFGDQWQEPSAWPPPRGFVPELSLVALDLDYRRGAVHMELRHAAHRFVHLADLVDHPNMKALALARAAACFRILDDHTTSRRHVDAALDLARTHAVHVEGEVHVVCLLALAVLQMRDYQLEEAENTCRDGLERAGRWQLVRLGSHLRSTLAQVLLARGRPTEALHELDRARGPYDDGTERLSYRIRAHARARAWSKAETLAEKERQRLEQLQQPWIRSIQHAFLHHAILDARLRRGRRDPDAIDWQQLAHDAHTAADISGERWPGAALRRIAWAADMRHQDGPDTVVTRIRQDLAVATRNPQSRWHLALTFVEAAACLDVTPAYARQLAREAFEHVPSDGAVTWFAPYLKRFLDTPTPDHALAWLEALRF